MKSLVLLKLSNSVLDRVLSDLSDEQIINILEHLDPDQAADVIQCLPDKRENRILNDLKEELRNEVKILTQFDPQTAAGLMNIDYIQVELASRMRDVAEKLEERAKKTGRVPIILVMDNGKLIGQLPVYLLGISKPEDHINEHVKKVSKIKHDADFRQVIKTFRNNSRNDQVVVIGDTGYVIGVLNVADIVKIIGSQESASLYDFAGVRSEESVLDSATSKINHRYKWLIINLGTAFLAAFTVSLFDETISKYVLLAIYMPIIAGMGGNAATQTLAVLVRGISLHQIDISNSWRTLLNESKAALVNGVLNGLIVALIVLVFNRDVNMAFVLGIAMVINLQVAAFFGTMVPLVMKRLGKDPASSATIFITTATDVLGFMVFLGLATIVLG
jgi:magnesium transporter